MMGSLDEHFGEDASLMPEPAARIATLLSSNANASWDTEAANELRDQQDPAHPLAVTRNRAWHQHHRDLAEPARASTDVGRPGNRRAARQAGALDCTRRAQQGQLRCVPPPRGARGLRR